jgi:hypothetical protein
VPHFAWGQAKLGAPFRMLAVAFASVFRSLGVILRERPDLVISTGAGSGDLRGVLGAPAGRAYRHRRVLRPLRETVVCSAASPRRSRMTWSSSPPTWPALPEGRAFSIRCA